MEIKIPSSSCTNGKAHYWVREDGSELWRCKHCHTVRWFPCTFAKAAEFSSLISQVGVDKAYNTMVHKDRKVLQSLKFVADLMEIRKHGITDKDIANIIVKVGGRLNDDSWEVRFKPAFRLPLVGSSQYSN